MECIYNIYFVPDDNIDSIMYKIKGDQGQFSTLYYAAGAMDIVLIKGDFVISEVSLYWSSTMELY